MNIVTLEVYLTTLFSKIFCFSDFFFGDGTGQTGRDGTDRTDRQTDIWTDRLFSENIILDAFASKTFAVYLFCLLYVQY